MKGNSFARFAKKAFKSRSRLHQHKFDHLKTESGFKCQFCKHIARGEKALATHVQRCHTEPKARKYECEICNKLLMSSTSLSAHKKTVHGYAFKFKCNWCNYSCKYKSSLDHHKLGHSEAKQEGFKCEICDFSTHYKKGVMLHMRTHDKPEKITCDICSKSYSSKESFSQHMRRHNDAVVTLKCNQCSYETQYHTNLARHIQTHEATDLFPCDHPSCDYAGNTEKALQTHKLQHDTNLAFQCEICQQRFRSKFILKGHVQKFHL